MAKAKKVVKKAVKKATVKQVKTKNLAAREIQAILGPKVTEKMLVHELHRFTTMDKKALFTRVSKVKIPVKLEAMRKVAKQVGERGIAKAARIRRDEVFAV